MDYICKDEEKTPRCSSALRAAFSEGITASGSPALGNRIHTTSRHVFRKYSYKKPTYCAHCGKLLVGLIKQGVRCKRCGIDIHAKCREVLQKPCIEVILGNHNFRLKRFTHITHCDYCRKVLKGMVHQGLKCSECGTSVHERCQEKIDIRCERTRSRRAKILARTSTMESASSADEGNKPKDKTITPSASFDRGSEDSIISDYSSMFETMPELPVTQDSPTNSLRSLPVTPKKNRKLTRSRSLDIEAISKMEEQIEQVTDIMRKNVHTLSEREGKLDTLQIKSEDLHEKSKIFGDLSRSIEKKYIWKNRKLCIVIAVAALLLVVALVVVVSFQVQ